MVQIGQFTKKSLVEYLAHKKSLLDSIKFRTEKQSFVAGLKFIRNKRKTSIRGRLYRVELKLTGLFFLFMSCYSCLVVPRFGEVISGFDC